MPTDVPLRRGSVSLILLGLLLSPLKSMAQNPSANAPASAEALPNTPPSSAPSATNQVTSETKPVSPENVDPNLQSQPVTVFSGLMDPFDYDPRGRRDPFGQPIPDKPMSQGGMHGPLLPLQKYELNQLRLTGIMWDVRQPKAIFKDPNGAIYIVGPNAKIGPRNGYVAVIREGEIVVVETVDQEGKLISTAQVVKIAK